MGDPNRTAREVVELCNLSVWNERDFEMADELVADTLIRHEVGAGHALTREHVRKGIEDFLALFDTLRWDLNLVVAGDEGEITEIWNGGEKQGLWL
jgi:hypothetical protein